MCYAMIVLCYVYYACFSSIMYYVLCCHVCFIYMLGVVYHMYLWYVITCDGFCVVCIMICVVCHMCCAMLLCVVSIMLAFVSMYYGCCVESFVFCMCCTCCYIVLWV